MVTVWGAGVGVNPKNVTVGPLTNTPGATEGGSVEVRTGGGKFVVLFGVVPMATGEKLAPCKVTDTELLGMAAGTGSPAVIPQERVIVPRNSTVPSARTVGVVEVTVQAKPLGAPASQTTAATARARQRSCKWPMVLKTFLFLNQSRYQIKHPIQ